ncbi:MAG: hypothetical protein ACRCXT_00525 [Paraclostridium sp.]
MKIRTIAHVNEDLALVQSASATASTLAGSTLSAAGIYAKPIQFSQIAVAVNANALQITTGAGSYLPIGMFVQLSNFNDAAKALRPYEHTLQVVKKVSDGVYSLGGFVPDSVTGITGGKVDVITLGMNRSTEAAVPYRIVGNKSGSYVTLAASISSVTYGLNAGDIMHFTINAESTPISGGFNTNSQRKSFEIISITDDQIVINDPLGWFDTSKKVLPHERATIDYGNKNLPTRNPQQMVIVGGLTDNDVYIVEMFC